MAASTPPPMHIADLQRLITRDPGRPRLTWYGDDGERVELSGAVLHNWVNKTVNLLVEEFDAGPGTRVLLDLPPHWRTVVWALATWRTGATLVLPPAAEGSTAVGQEETSGSDDADSRTPAATDADIVVTSRPASWAGTGAQLVAVPLPALARRFDGDLPPGTIDAGSAVMTYGDQIGWVEETDPDRAAIDPEVSHAGLVAWALAGPPLPTTPAPRTLVGEEHALPLLRRTLRALALDGSVVVTSVGATAALTNDPARLERLRTTERITD
ncbi:TIGR03089 family protein [Oerskovia sp. NPDC057915]|uniref:TIGR03089 family protein n=1 Tax=Oerskovia sp. NPDC057915 TaxID=3346280 RepID=UPI0036DF3AFA